MKKLFLSLSTVSVLFSSCMGEYALFHKLDEWNKGVTNNKYVNNAVYWVLNIIPVYGIAFTLDQIVFNVIEFWTGSNPVALKPGESKEKIVTKEGVSYKMIATHNAMTVQVLDGENSGKAIQIIYSPLKRNWSMIDVNGETITLASVKEGLLHVYLPNKTVTVPINATQSEGLAIIGGATSFVVLK